MMELVCAVFVRDVEHLNESEMVLISDRDKGIMDAMATQFPRAHRECVVNTLAPIYSDGLAS